MIILNENRKHVSFLYKFLPGVCPKSYGMNVARMAGLPSEIVDEAETIAIEFEQVHKETMYFLFD